MKNDRDQARRLNCAAGRTRFIDKAMQQWEIGEESRDCEARITRAYYDTLAVRVPYYRFLYFYHFISLECSSNDVRVEMGKRNRKRTVMKKSGRRVGRGSKDRKKKNRVDDDIIYRRRDISTSMLHLRFIHN